MDWTCSGCGRHFNWTVSECPYCRHQTTITTGGTQPTDTQQLKDSISLFKDVVHRLKRGEIQFMDIDLVRELNEGIAKLESI